MFRSGFVSVIGRPNVGKSTLINALLGRKALIVSDKPQTTRNRIQAIYTGDDFQIVFLDTPGIHKPRHRLGDYMLKSALDALKEVDLILFMVEAPHPPGPGDRYIAGLLRDLDTPKFLVVNKMDLAGEEFAEKLLPLYMQLGEFERFYDISALEGKNVYALLEGVCQLLPEGPQYYPPGTVIDRPQEFVAAEIIREKILLKTREEIPHSVAVEIEDMHFRHAETSLAERPLSTENRPPQAPAVEKVTTGNGSTENFPLALTADRSRSRRTREDLLLIGAVIYVEKESQKKIIIGKKGGMLKEIGTEARRELERIFGSRVFLELWVKVKKDWRQKGHNLRQLGYE